MGGEERGSEKREKRGRKRTREGKGEVERVGGKEKKK